MTGNPQLFTNNALSVDFLPFPQPVGGGALVVTPPTFFYPIGTPGAFTAAAEWQIFGSNAQFVATLFTKAAGFSYQVDYFAESLTSPGVFNIATTGPLDLTAGVDKDPIAQTATYPAALTTQAVNTTTTATQPWAKGLYQLSAVLSFGGVAMNAFMLGPLIEIK